MPCVEAWRTSFNTAEIATAQAGRFLRAANPDLNGSHSKNLPLMLTITKSRENVLDSINLHLKIYSVDHQLKAEPMLLLKSDFLIRKTH